MEYLKVDATSHVEVLTKCPYCDSFEDVFDDVREILDECLSVNGCDKEVTCSECGKIFIVENVSI